jgi:transposase
MRQHCLRDDQWDWIKDTPPGRAGSVGVTAVDNRRFVDAVLYRYRSGIPWRDLPEKLADWNNTRGASAAGLPGVSGKRCSPCWWLIRITNTQ